MEMKSKNKSVEKCKEEVKKSLCKWVEDGIDNIEVTEEEDYAHIAFIFNDGAKKRNVKFTGLYNGDTGGAVAALGDLIFKMAKMYNAPIDDLVESASKYAKYLADRNEEIK